MRQYLSLGRRPNFTAQPYSLARRPNFAAQLWPCLVPGCRLVPSKIAASGIENALLAMTESVGFSKKRDSFQIEMFEKRCSATPCKKTAYNNKRPFSKQNRPNFVSLRGAQRRGNLKAKGMAFLGEARCPRETDFKHFGNKNDRFYYKTYHFCVIARPPCGRGNLKVIGVESRSEAREQKTAESPNSDPSRRDTTARRRFILPRGT